MKETVIASTDNDCKWSNLGKYEPPCQIVTLKRELFLLNKSCMLAWDLATIQHGIL